MNIKLKKLGYTEKWIRYGLLSKVTLEKQLIDFESGDDPHTEHFRHQTFTNWLESKKHLTNSEIENFIELAIEDEDQVMAGSVVVKLLTHSEITNNQFKFIAEKLATFGSWTVKVIQRELLKRKL